VLRAFDSRSRSRPRELRVKTMKDWLAYTVALSAALLAQILIVGLR
jgi:hypothetical protein